MLLNSSFLKKKIPLHLPVWMVAASPFALYIVWSYYWFTKVHLSFIKWHTHVMVYVYLWFIGMTILSFTKRKHASELQKNILLLFSAVIFSLAVVEIYLHVSGKVNTYLEKASGYYTSPYHPLDQTHYHGWMPGKPHLIKKPEYSFLFPTNSFGMPDVEWPVCKEDGEARILALGDSFTEGDGAPHDSNYPSLLKQMLKDAEINQFTVMNGGVSGSDPFLNFVALRDLLLPYKPDIVLQELSSDDITTDIVIRGGMERFLPNGKQKFKDGPWWEFIYAVNYLSRFYFHHVGYNEILRKGYPSKEESREINSKLNALFSDFDSLSKVNGIRLIIFLKPDREEIMANKYRYDFTLILTHLQKNLNVEFFDLLPFYQQHITRSNSDVKDYFWVYDGHHNSKGYKMMAEGIYSYLIDSTSQLMLRRNLQHPVN